VTATRSAINAKHRAEAADFRLLDTLANRCVRRARTTDLKVSTAAEYSSNRMVWHV
jgi:hypothetical protein